MRKSTAACARAEMVIKRETMSSAIIFFFITFIINILGVLRVYAITLIQYGNTPIGGEIVSAERILNIGN
jgi:hypothetical protein